MIKKNKAKGNFDIIFEKLDQMGESKQEVSDLVNESSAINKLREMVLEVNEENERYFSTT
jgi:hypothetical protein